jgi:hypothetical protein
MSGRVAETLKRFQYADTPHSRKLLQTVRKYGLTLWEWENFGHAQEWKCPGCGLFNRGGGHLVIDHCHSTGTVRGLLCHSCNITLGWARDNPRTLRRLAAYLESVAPERANDA